MNPFFGSREVVWQAALSILICSLVLVLPACHAQPSKPVTTGASATVDKTPAKAPMGTRIELTLTGYNYTSRYIDQFDVDGQGGGNIGVSGPNTAGSGSVCCVSYRSGAGPWRAKIRWQSDACTYNERTSGGEKFSDIYSFFKEIEVQIDPEIPDFPRYFEVHIYPDGHAEAAITEHESRARLVLSKEREDNSAFPRCPNDKKPNISAVGVTVAPSMPYLEALRCAADQARSVPVGAAPKPDRVQSQPGSCLDKRQRARSGQLNLG